jgi:GT2 family glycosyltransferase
MAEAGCDIVDIKFDGPLEGVDLPPGERDVMVVFWHGDVPLGRTIIPRDAFPLSGHALVRLGARVAAGAVAARLRPGSDDAEALVSRLTGLSDPLSIVCASRPPGSATDVAVIVCTRGRPTHLETCLRSLANMNPEPGEIIVVDNNQHGETASREVVERFPQIRYVSEPRPGLSRARNAGIRATRKAIIAFTDDDVAVARGWAGAVSAAFAREAVDGLTGIVLPNTIDGAGQAYFELQIGALFKGFEPRVFDPESFVPGQSPVWMIGAGANMAFRRSVFEQLGGFDERLGAGASGCSEDSELWYRMLAAGCRIAYRPDCVVHHSHRGSDEDVALQLHAYMRGHVAALLAQFARHRHWGNLRRALFGLPVHLVRKRLAASRQLEPWRRRFATAELRGCFAGLDPRYLAREDPPVMT